MPAIARVGDRTATGDPIIGPGVPSVMVNGKPAAVLFDQVSGPNCIGQITTASPTVYIGGKPAARVTSTVVGVHPGTGAAVTTTINEGSSKMNIP